MHIDIARLIESLQHDRFDPTNPRVPDGVADLSEYVLPLRAISREGRALRSSEDYSKAGLIGRLLHEYLGGAPSVEALERAVVGIAVLVVCILEATCKLKPDLMPEEILMDAASDDAIRLLAEDFANAEYTVDESGQMHVNLASLSIFAKATPLDLRARDGFIRRRLTPLLEDIFESPMSASEDGDDHLENSADDQPTSHKVNFVDETELGELIADPLEGFDEEQEYFERTDYQRFMNGDSLDEILRDDPSEPDYRIGES